MTAECGQDLQCFFIALSCYHMPCYAMLCYALLCHAMQTLHGKAYVLMPLQ